MSASTSPSPVLPSDLAKTLGDLVEFAQRVCNGGDCSRPGACVRTAEAIQRAESLLARYDAQQAIGRASVAAGEPGYRYYPRLYQGGPYRAEFTPAALKTVAATYERSAVDRVEYSAILVGHYSDDCTTAIVDRLICILRGEPFQVVQSPEYAATVSTVLRELWDKESGSYYLGDWHTHPLNLSAPSQVDIETSRERASDPKTQCPQLLMAITGCNGTSVHIVTADSLTSLLPQEEP